MLTDTISCLIIFAGAFTARRPPDPSDGLERYFRLGRGLGTPEQGWDGPNCILLRTRKDEDAIRKVLLSRVFFFSFSG